MLAQKDREGHRRHAKAARLRRRRRSVAPARTDGPRDQGRCGPGLAQGRDAGRAGRQPSVADRRETRRTHPFEPADDGVEDPDLRPVEAGPEIPHHRRRERYRQDDDRRPEVVPAELPADDAARSARRSRKWRRRRPPPHASPTGRWGRCGSSSPARRWRRPRRSTFGHPRASRRMGRRYMARSAPRPRPSGRTSRSARMSMQWPPHPRRARSGRRRAVPRSGRRSGEPARALSRPARRPRFPAERGSGATTGACGDEPAGRIAAEDIGDGAAPGDPEPQACAGP